MTALTINVIGNPIPQGSKVANHHAPGVRRGNGWRVEWTDRNGLERRAWCATWHIALVHALDCAAKTRRTR